jgi:transglutaminase-like putative cysteine protease
MMCDGSSPARHPSSRQLLDSAEGAGARARLHARPPREYLLEDEIVDFSAPAVGVLAGRLWEEAGGDELRFARMAFEYVRDRIAHAWDVGDRRVTLSASETLREGVGLCYAKAHLLAALLRAQQIPAGLCYQRLVDDDGRHEVHGLVAAYLKGAWRRQDPRGNKPGVDAQFSLGPERLAWPVRPELGERDYPEVFVRPHPAVVAALRGASDVLELCGGGLPEDLCPAAESSAPVDVRAR